jgi:cytochrome c oxidase subunit 2
MRPRKSWIRVVSARVALIGVALLGAACARNAPLDTLRPAGPIAQEIDDLWKIVFWMAAVVFVIVEGAFVVAMIRFRHRKGDTTEPRQTHGNTPLELGWTVAPALVLAALAIPTVTTIFALARERPNSLDVTVTAHQWWWRYDYPDQKVTTANELHIPTGRPVRLALKSADIIHSYWIPRLGGKQDVTPGRTNHLTIQASRPGKYAGTCVEYCGLSHANMRLEVIAHSPADFARWARKQSEERMEPDSTLARRGEKIFLAQQCVACHTIRGTKAEGTTGPDLTHFAARRTFAGAIFDTNERNLRLWLADAPAQKPGSKMPAGISEMGLSNEDITALIAYLQGLR